MAIKKIYSDLDLKFTRSPVTGDIAMGYDEKSVIRSINNLLLTNRFERLFQPDLGSNLQALLFENISPLLETTIAKEIQNVIENYEPRAQIYEINVTARDDLNAYETSLVFFISNNTAPTQVNLLLERNR